MVEGSSHDALLHLYHHSDTLVIYQRYALHELFDIFQINLFGLKEVSSSHAREACSSFNFSLFLKTWKNHVSQQNISTPRPPSAQLTSISRSTLRCLFSSPLPRIFFIVHCIVFNPFFFPRRVICSENPPPPPHSIHKSTPFFFPPPQTFSPPSALPCPPSSPSHGCQRQCRQHSIKME